MSLNVIAKPGHPVSCATCGHGFPQDPCYSVPCPDCGAKSGAYCQRPSGHSGPFCSFHVGRDLAALRAGFYDHQAPSGHPCGPQSTDPHLPGDPPPETQAALEAQLPLFAAMV